MDSSLFRMDKRPSKSQYGNPTPDSRFPGWAGPLKDGRLVTDYRPHCELNVPSKAQEKTRIWMQHNADDIMGVTRQRLATNSGMIYGVNATIVPPPTHRIKCTAAGCETVATGEAESIGTERQSQPLPYLFGTYEPIMYSRSRPTKTGLNTVYEGGRNSRR